MVYGMNPGIRTSDNNSQFFARKVKRMVSRERCDLLIVKPLASRSEPPEAFRCPAYAVSPVYIIQLKKILEQQYGVI